ncbi:MAG: putative viral replication protein [Doliovirus lythtis]|uniref:Putative viral replication protein n=1 Tax=Circoviridae sp. TaxID=1954248 RepID=A0A345MQ98_9VIRU|nr:MAG: putative viral replication protein [Circoviridae sp.]
MPPGGQAKRWVFTLHNYTDDEEQALGDFAEEFCDYCVAGKEETEEGTPHLQGFFILKTKRTLRFIKSQLGDRLHLEISRGTPTQAADYCKKDGDFEEWGEITSQGRRSDWEAFRDWVKEQEARPTERLMADRFPGIWGRYRNSALAMCQLFHPVQDMVPDTPKEWQVVLKGRLCAEPDDRRIHFVVDPDGNTGKSWFCRWMLSKMPDEVQILGIGKRDDMAHMVDTNKSIFLLNVPRGQMEFLQYGILEMLKDRMVSSPKYESVMKTMVHQPQVCVFSNEMPDMNRMSPDRYELFDINNHGGP